MMDVVCIYKDCYDMYSREMHVAGSVIMFSLFFQGNHFVLTSSIKNGQESSRILQNGKTRIVQESLVMVIRMAIKQRILKDVGAVVVQVR